MVGVVDVEIKRNVVALVERNQKKCGGLGGRNRNLVVVGGGGGGKTIEMWWLYIASLFTKLC